ncbi:hypothetical protein P3X46_026738 [Hevea brasiliensis]|uniref:non-specific serine/threonine protein kinase n=1 Tax=Hevea brasiliensis TaxID=3981 RepID=A0ABQ9KXW4_HEVBR|nr:hypothetical protein P3X46_026738 [Hevea brasiliensis]
MQVAVSKYTEGINNKALRPNGLPKSLILYDARQKDKALDSITEVVQTLKDHKSHIRAMIHDTSVNLDYVLPNSVDSNTINSGTPGRQTPQLDSTDDVSQEAAKKTRKSSLMGHLKVISAIHWFLQGPETDQAIVSKIRDAIREQRGITVQLINYTKNGKKFWNLFHLQPMHDRKVKATAENVDEAVRELPDANSTADDLCALHSQPIFPRPHKRDIASWIAIQKITSCGVKIGIQHFKPIKPLGCGDTGSVHLVELKGTGQLYAMKAVEKSMMLNRNKVHRACTEREIISLLDHPFLPTLYTSFQTSTHVYLITDFCPGGELFALLDKQPKKLFKEESVTFYAAEVVVSLEYLHCLGIIYRDLKPENILLQKDGHVVLTDFDLSFMGSCKPQIIKHLLPNDQRSRSQPLPTFVAEPATQSNSFVGTGEYIAPEIITGTGHSSAIDWWSFGILLYEMLYGHTPFRGNNRQKTFANILHKDLTFPSNIPVSLAARQLINALLSRDPGIRLGSKTGANEIKHPFFRGINWPLIRCMSPPPLDVPLQLIEKDPNAKDVTWEDDGVLESSESSMHMEIF